MIFCNKNPILKIALAALSLAFAAQQPAARADETPKVLSTLRRGHPRVTINPDSLAELRAGTQNDPARAELLALLKVRADKILTAPLVVYSLSQHQALLNEIRTCRGNITLCALMYRLTEDPRYARRAIDEMLHAASLPTWAPAHFLGVAEMACGMGIGYDWLYDQLSDQERQSVRQAIVDKALRESLKAYDKRVWWTTSTNNWNVVCVGGLAIGSLAIADEEPELAAQVLELGVDNVPVMFNQWGHDGAWNEGINYWSYTIQYTALYLDALQSALGTMFDLEKTPGLDQSGLFRIYMHSAIKNVFNYADTGQGAGTSSAMFFLSRLYDKPVYAWHHRQEAMTSAYDLLWFDPRGRSPGAEGLPTDRIFSSVDVALMRSAWDDPEATYIGIKGGDNSLAHGQLDIGTFVYDAQGKRWAFDLGSDDYTLKGYFGPERWNYYRLNTQGQNTLVINGRNQPMEAKAKIIASHMTGDPSVTIDMAQAYPMTQKVIRTAQRQGAAMVLKDQITAEKPVDVVWQMHTQATATSGVGTNQLVLHQGDRDLTLVLAEPAGAVFEFADVAPDPATFKRSLHGIHKVTITVPQAGATEIRVGFFPGKLEQAPDVDIKP